MGLKGAPEPQPGRLPGVWLIPGAAPGWISRAAGRTRSIGAIPPPEGHDERIDIRPDPGRAREGGNDLRLPGPGGPWCAGEATAQPSRTPAPRAPRQADPRRVLRDAGAAGHGAPGCPVVRDRPCELPTRARRVREDGLTAPGADRHLPPDPARQVTPTAVHPDARSHAARPRRSTCRPHPSGTPPLTRPPNRPTSCARSSPRSHPASSVIGDRGDRNLR